MRTFLLGVAIALVAAQPASAARMPVQGLTVHFGECPGYQDGGSCTQPETAEVWVDDDATRFDFWHEVGHVFDHQVLDDHARAWFTQALGFQAGTPWTGAENFYTEHNFSKRTPDEVFADAFAACWLRLKPVRRGGLVVLDWTTAYGYRPTVRQHRRVCNAIAVFDLLVR